MNAQHLAQQIWLAIRRERAYQEAKYGPADARRLSVGDYLTILRRELREADDAFCEQIGVDAALLEVLQVAAVAVACLEAHGVVER